MPVSGASRVNDESANEAPEGHADLRVVGNASRALPIHWQLPNLAGDSNNDNWVLYRGTGNLGKRNLLKYQYGAEFLFVVFMRALSA